MTRSEAKELLAIFRRENTAVPPIDPRRLSRAFVRLLDSPSTLEQMRRFSGKREMVQQRRAASCGSG